MVGGVQLKRFPVALGERILSVLADRQSDAHAVPAPV
jgi:hypothetical protein